MIDAFQLHFSQGVVVYEMTDSRQLLLQKRPIVQSDETMTIGLYEGHAFVITDLNRFNNAYTCPDCQVRFTKPEHLSRHVKCYCKNGPKLPW